VILTVNTRGNRFWLASPWEFKDAAKAIPGGLWSPKEKTPPRGSWHYPATAAVAESIARAAKQHSAQLDFDEPFAVALEAAREAFRARRNRDRTDLDDLPTTTTAWNHQRQAYHFALGQPSAMLAMDMGTGKSLTAIGLFEGWGCKTAIILCPTSVVNVWPREFRKHAARPWRVIAPRGGSVAKRTAEMKAAVESATDYSPVAVVINYEASWREPFATWALTVPWDVALCDESHRIKAPGGKQSMWAHRLGHVAKRKLALTGTPLAHGPLDIYAQFRFLDEGIFGTSHNRFKRRFAVMGGYGGYEVVGYQNEDELAERMGRLAYQCKAADVLDLPGERDTTRAVTLGPKARAAYDALWNDYMAEVDGGEVIATNSLTQLLRIQQVTSGHLPVQDDPDDEDTKRIVEVGTEKRDLLEDYLRDIPADPAKPGAEPVVVFARFTHDLANVRAVAAKLGRTYGEISGRSKNALAGDATMAAGLDVVGVQISSGGVGIDLTRSRYGVYYSLGFSLTDYLQSRARLHRPGQERSVLYTHLVAEGTIDEAVYRALAARQDVIEVVLAAARGGQREGATA
jgi:SNF2 family DNA or RNA helicase